MSHQRFGTTPAKEEIYLYTLAAEGITARITNLGACLVSLEVPDRSGALADVVLGYDTAEGYLTNEPFFGATVGPNANRIAAAELSIGETTYHMEQNEGPNNLHSSATAGLHKRVWHADEEAERSVTLSCELKDGELGLPGARRFTATYELTGPGTLLLTYTATTSAPTVVNLTNHSYFNLGGVNPASSVLNHELTLGASRYTPSNAASIPTGEIAEVAGTPLDFTVSHALGERINEPFEQLLFAHGYDHNYAIDGWNGNGELRFAARLKDPASGRVLTLSTDQPGLMVYSANFTNEDGKAGQHFGLRSAVALEPQHWPDAPHHRNFPSTVLLPGETYRLQAEYRFTCEG